VIDSVHSFGQSLIGTFFLVFLIASSLLTVGIIAARRSLLRSENQLEGLFGREGMFLATNILLVVMMIATTIGTMFPVISRLFTGQQVTPTTGFYNKMVAPLGLVLVAMMAVGPLLGYGVSGAKRLGKGLIVPGIIAAAAIAAFILKGVYNVWALACVAIFTIVVANIVIETVRALMTRIMTTGENAVTALVRLLDGNHRRYGGQIVHLGVMLMVAGIVGSSLFSQKQSLQMHPGESVQVAGQTMTLIELRETRKQNFTAVEAVVTLTDAKNKQVELSPQRRFYDKAEEANTEVAIQTGWCQDVYLTLAGWEPNGKTVAIETIVNPLVSWIWVGGIVLTAGTIFALLPRLFATAAHAEQDQKEPKAAIAGRPAPAA
jgi:cytochrome c-type biogenesis protein CcmF